MSYGEPETMHAGAYGIFYGVLRVWSQCGLESCNRIVRLQLKMDAFEGGFCDEVRLYGHLDIQGGYEAKKIKISQLEFLCTLTLL